MRFFLSQKGDMVRMPTKDLLSHPLLTEDEIKNFQQLISGSILRPGERMLGIVLLDLTSRTAEQNELLKEILAELKKGKPAVKEAKEALPSR